MKKLGFGCMRLPVLGESKDFMSAEDIDLAQFCQMVDTFMERGFTYFDTSYVYHNGKSEVFLKEALVKHYPRESFLLADKLPTFSITRPEQVPVILSKMILWLRHPEIYSSAICPRSVPIDSKHQQSSAHEYKPFNHIQ